MRSLLSRLLNAQDKSVDLYLTLAFSTVIIFLGLAIFDVVKLGHEFRAIDFGQGIGLVIVGTGLGNWLHSKGIGSNQGS